MSDDSNKKSGNRNGDGVVKPIAIYYEQPNWFVPLFAQMDARGGWGLAANLRMKSI